MAAKRALYLECNAGVCGSMLLGAMIDLEVPVGHIENELAKLGIGGYKLVAFETKEKALRATRARVYVEAHQDHRRLQNIVELLDRSALTTSIKTRAKAIFRRLAAAEAEVHGFDIAQVHFHEVGATDAIVDIVGVLVAIEYLKIDKLYCSPIATGHGRVVCEHGFIPIPSPGAAQLLCGVPIYAGTQSRELTTPTGAAIVRELVDEFCSLPSMVVRSVGYGAGDHALTIPNVLRAFLGEVGGEPGHISSAVPLLQTDNSDEEIYKVETTIDDQLPETIGYVCETLLARGVLDVFSAPVYMKKFRPGTQIDVLCRPGMVQAVIDFLQQETTSFGVRYYRLRRNVLDRRYITVETIYGSVSVKLGFKHGRLLKFSPEFEDCKAAAGRYSVPLHSVYMEAQQAARVKVRQQQCQWVDQP